MWLEVTYQGLAPPTALFADLELVGWAAPTIAPPPHDAIDWSSPNEATGERFTLRDYTVPGAVVQPPSGTASRGTWNDAERASHLAALRRVLDRHPDVDIEDPSALVTTSAPTTTAPPATNALPPPPTAAAPPPPAAFRPSEGATAVLITAPLKPSLAPRAEDALVALGVTVVFDSQERVKTERYRGSSYQTTVTELHLAAIAAPDQLDAVVATLGAFGLPLTFAEVDKVDVAPDQPAEPEPASAASAAGTAPEHRRDVGLALVVALADPRAADAVDGVIRSLGLVDASATPTTRTEISTYRGSRSEREVPTLRVEAWVPEPHAKLVATHLAEATHLRVGDLERLWIVPPDPATDHATGEDAAQAGAGGADPTGSVAPVIVAADDAAADDTADDTPADETVTADAAPGGAHADDAAAVPGPLPASDAGPALDPRALVRRPQPVFVDHGR